MVKIFGTLCTDDVTSIFFFPQPHSGDDVRASREMGFQSVRFDQGLASGGFSVEAGRKNDPGSESEKLLRRSRTIRLQSGQPRARNRTQS